MSDLVRQQLADIRQRLTELNTERRQLEAAATALAASLEDTEGPVRRKGSRGRKPNRVNETLEYLTQHPGSKPADIAAAIGVQRPYIYRTLARLESEGLAIGDTDGVWWPAG